MVLGCTLGGGAQAAGLVTPPHSPLSAEAILRRGMQALCAPDGSRVFEARLLHVAEKPGESGVAVKALVRLTWAPGWRQRPLTGRGRDAAAAAADLLAQMPVAFAEALRPVGAGGEQGAL